MKKRQLPQQVLVRLADLEDRVENLEREAVAAESAVQALRTTLSSRTTGKTIAETKLAAESFDSIYDDAQLKRSRATAQGKLLASVKAWIEELPANVKLVLVHPEIGTASLEQVRGELAAMRSDLSKLKGNPPASLDIGRRVDEMVQRWARTATPAVRGFANGERLDLLWAESPGSNPQNLSGYNRDACNGLCMFAALFPTELSEHIFRAIHAAQPLSAQQHSEKVLQLNARINEASYTEAALCERAGVEHSIETAPHCVLGVRVGETETGEAAA